MVTASYYSGLPGHVALGTDVGGGLGGVGGRVIVRAAGHCVGGAREVRCCHAGMGKER